MYLIFERKTKDVTVPILDVASFDVMTTIDLGPDDTGVFPTSDTSSPLISPDA